jgi:hypothetical protein
VHTTRLRLLLRTVNREVSAGLFLVARRHLPGFFQYYVQACSLPMLMLFSSGNYSGPRQWGKGDHERLQQEQTA